jgi:transposase
MRGYSIDLRKRIVKAVLEEKQSSQEVAQRFGVSRWTVERYLKRAAEGNLAASKPPGRPRSLDEAGVALLKTQVNEHPDWTLEQHAAALSGAKAAQLKKSSIGNYFKRLSITIK